MTTSISQSSKQDLEYMLSEIKKDDPYAEYNRHAPVSDSILRTVKTPEPRDMTGKEWKQVFNHPRMILFCQRKICLEPFLLFTAAEGTV